MGNSRKIENNCNVSVDFNQKVPYISFLPLEQIPFIRHGFSTKLGGVSRGMFSSMNLGYQSGPYRDDPELVKKNYELMADRIGIDPSTIVMSKQVHKTNIRFVTEEDCGKGLYRERDYDEIDGLITNIPNITLVTHYADCVPLFFVDTKQKAIGLTHSGWRGTVAKIGKTTIKEMQKAFLSNPKDIIAVIGPSICGDCYEVGEEVALEFEKEFQEIDCSTIITSKEHGKYHCDLWQANKAVLLEAGLAPEHIHISGVCTSCNSDILFSHRKTNGQRGVLAAFLTLTIQ